MALLSYLGLLVYAVALLIWGYSENTVVLANGAAVFFLAMFVMDLGRGAMRILLPREFALLLVFVSFSKYLNKWVLPVPRLP